MLSLIDKSTNSVHNFELTSVNTGTHAEFKLQSATYPGQSINFKLQPPLQKLPTGYTVKIQLLKNKYYLQSDIIDIRADDICDNSGKIGYIFSLDALFETGILDLNEHIYCYAYYALEYLFSNNYTHQTKEVEISAKTYKISDFFDEDTKILVLCEQFCNKLADFNLNDYLPNLYQYGFIAFDINNPLPNIRHIAFLQNKYYSLQVSSKKNPVKILRLEKRNELLKDNYYIYNLFTKLIHRERDEITRFLMAYQVVEIYISVLFEYELRNEICSKIGTLNPHKLKDKLRDIQTHGSIMKSLFNRYARPTADLISDINSKIIDFFNYINHPEYTDPGKNALLTISELTYDLRNKLVHEYRWLHQTGIDGSEISRKINYLNDLFEVLMAEAISKFKA